MLGEVFKKISIFVIAVILLLLFLFVCHKNHEFDKIKSSVKNIEEYYLQNKNQELHNGGENVMDVSLLCGFE